MGKAKDRKRRDKLSKKLDITKPITLEMLGSGEDPCFGKLYDPRTKECQRCGDSELCAIALGQLTHIARAEVEKEKKFKDMEEKDIKNKMTPKEIKRAIKNRIVELVSNRKEIAIEEVVLDLYGLFCHDGYTKPRLLKRIDRVTESSNKITKNKTHLKWKM